MKMFGILQKAKFIGMFPNVSGYILCILMIVCLLSLDGAVKKTDSAFCGNGVVEEGEECDCGGVNNCTEQEPCCDRENCKYRSVEYKCRDNSITYDPSCDLPEYCSGSSGECPEDSYKRDGYECWKNEEMSYCYSGRCRSHTDQCRYYWGAESKNAVDYCYEQLNMMGNRYGNCGVNEDGSYKHCSDEDGYCGKLYCEKDPEKRINIGVSYAIYTITYMNGDEDEGIKCVSVNISLGNNERDPGLVYDGTICGKKSMCIENKCVNLSSIATQRCPEQDGQECSGNGICSNLLKCHCKHRNYTNPELCIGTLLSSKGDKLNHFSIYFYSLFALVLLEILSY